MNKRRVFITVLLAFVLSFVCAFVAACSKKNDTNKDVEVTAVTLSKDSVELQLGVTTTVTLTAVVSPDNATDKTVTWTSDNTSVATVANGVVTAVAVGSATITATAGSKSDTCAVTVKAAPAEHTHTAAGEWQSDETDHWHNCTESTCIAQLDKAAHVYDDEQDTTCNVCGYTRTVTPPVEEHTHTADSTWHTDETNHWHECTAGDGEKLELAAHTYDNEQDTTCNVCGYERTVTPPVEEHTHTADSTWHTDETSHWHECTAGDGEKLELAAHTYDNEQDTTCNVCGYTRTVAPSDYTENGDYVLDIAGLGANNASIFTVDNAAGNGFAESLDGTKYFKLSSSGSTYDCLYINLKLQTRKVITITGTMRPGSSGRTATLGITLDSTSTGSVSGIGNVEASAETVINKVITVSTEGNIKLALKRATTATGVEFLDFKVTISDPEPVNVQSVSLDKNNASLKVGETDTLTATVSPEDADNKNIKWVSSDITVATVENGVVTAKKEGTVTISAVSLADETKYASCEYTISNVAPTSIELNRTTATIAVGDTLQLTANVLPSNATVKTVTWSSSATSVATVDANGKVTAVGTGNVTITATSTEDASVKATCTIEIKSTIVYATGISLNYSNENLKVDDTLPLTATITPDDTDDKSVTWTTSNASVATVSASGLVTVVGEGTAVITATSNSNSSKYAECTITASYQTYTVTFMDGTTNKGSQTVKKGETATRPTDITKDDYAVEGWYTDSALTTKYNFSTPVTEDITLYVKWVEATMNVTYSQGNFESAAIEWDDVNAAGATVEYKLASADDLAYVQVDSELIRQADSDTARVDVLGLKGNESYDFRITSSSNGEAVVTLDVKAYDRSGYAHFNYTDGVGAYKDDGTLKDNALVIYVTEENKNTVNTGYVDGQEVDLTPYLWEGKTGIGWILNNRAYGSNTERASYGIQKLSFTYGAVVIRLIGTVNAENSSDAKVSLINGLTAYDSTENGGSTGDNGRMARITNAKNLTIEGVGEDAVMFGWGVHFVSNDNLHQYEGSGKSFEVRNITFENYPEDAIGMEGTQGTSVDSTGSITAGASSATADLISPVERCWIHHNVFKLGYCASPAESDKAEGDGSCDFKRGQYYTLSYNYFTDCHKTNLIGSASTSLTFNVTMHHNWWHNVESRQPLARRANIHYYNNYITGASSYVISARADCYILAEGNYFYGCKNISDTGEGAGVIKAYNNVYNGNFGTDISNIVTDRTATVSNSCQFSYRNINYSSFDTNPDQFYYDAENGVSDCFLEDAVSARKTVMTQAGTLGFGKTNTDMNENTPEGALSIPEEGLTVNLSSISGSGIMGAAKGKGQVITFRLAERADITVACSGGVLAGADGTVYADQFTSYTGTLEAGIYFISSKQLAFSGDLLGGANLKEVTVTSLSFKSGVSDAEKVENVIALINDIGEVSNTAECKSKIEMAESAYSALSASLQSQVTNAATLTQKVNEYNQLVAQPVIDLIAAIGTVTVDSGTKIAEARNAYGALTAAQKALVTNYSVLVAAEEAYVEYEVEGINNAIEALADPSTVSTEADIESLLNQYNNVKTMYEDLDEDKKAEIINYSKVTEGITALSEKLTQVQAYAAITEKLEAVTDVSSLSNAECAEIVALYDKLSADKKTEISTDETYIAVKDKYDTYMSQAIVAIFTDEDTTLASNAGFTVSGNYSDKTYTYGDNTYNRALKMESSTSITFTTTVEMRITLVFHSSSSNTKFKVDSTTYTVNADKTYTLELAAGDHTIAKGDTNMFLCYVILEPVA